MSLNATAPYTPAQLVELGQSEAVGILDQDRVHPRDVEPALDNGGAEHHIGFPGVERHHGALQFAFRHLAVGHKQFQAGQHLPQSRSHILDALHPRHHIEHLPASVQLLTDGAAHRFRIQGSQMGFDRTTQRRWSGDQAHLPHAGQAHVQRSGDRRRRQGEDVDVLAQHLDLLFLIDAEALFLVDHQQAELLERGSLAEQLMGADHRIDGAALEALKDRLPL